MIPDPAPVGDTVHTIAKVQPKHRLDHGKRFSDDGVGFHESFEFQHIAVLPSQPRNQGFTLSLTDATTAFAADELLTGVGELKVRIVQGAPVGQPALSAAGVDLIPPGMASNVGRAGRTYHPRLYRFWEQRLEPRQGPFEAPA